MSLEDRLYPLLAVYERMPRSAKVALGSLYRGLPVSIRLGSRYAEFRDLATQVESWSQNQVMEYQFQQLRSTLVHAKQYSPFYAERFAKAGFRPERMTEPGDLAGCPYLTKEDLALYGRSTLPTSSPPSSQRLYITTGGSTGAPVGFYIHKGVSRPKEQAFLEAQWRRAGYFDGARIALLRGNVTSSRSRGSIASYDATRDWLVLSSYHLSLRRLPEYLDELTRFRPDILHAYPSAALQLADLLQRARVPWPIKLRCVLAGSEKLTVPQKRLLEQAFGCRIFTWYGHSERVILAGEGRTSSLLYFWPTYGFVEFGPADGDGLCEIIGTSFHNLVMPLIRYKTGDYARVYQPHIDGPKEFPWSAVRSVEGRSHEFLITGEGRKVSLTALNMHDESFEGLYALQFFQDHPGRAELRYVPGPSFDKRRLSQVEAAVQHKLGDDMEIVLLEVAEVERTSRGKGKWLVSSLGEQG